MLGVIFEMISLFKFILFWKMRVFFVEVGGLINYIGLIFGIVIDFMKGGVINLIFVYFFLNFKVE